MLLAIDCGNTNTVFSIWNGTGFVATWRIATDHKRTADEYFVWFSSLMAMTKTEAQITEAIISSTVQSNAAGAPFKSRAPVTAVSHSAPS